MPIFIYKTCITIHGNLGDIQRTRIGRYKNLHQCDNGSLEVRYNAIDYKEKKLLCRLINYREQINSQSFNIVQGYTYTSREQALTKMQELKKFWEGLKIEGMKYKSIVQGFQYYGTYYVESLLIPLLITGDIYEIASSISGVNANQLRQQEADRLQAIKDEQEAREKQKQEREQLHANKLAELKSQYREAEKLVQGGEYIVLNPSGSTPTIRIKNRNNFGLCEIEIKQKDGTYTEHKRKMKRSDFSHIFELSVPIQDNTLKVTYKPKETTTTGTPDAINVKGEIYKNCILITGDTFPIKDTLKNNGGKWNGALKGWIFPTNNNFANQYLTNQ